MQHQAADRDDFGTEDSKRKRGTENMEKIFKRSKKITRSSTSYKNTEMGEVMEVFKQLMGKIAKIRRENNYMNEMFAIMKN